jgi:hypothetical protein
MPNPIVCSLLTRRAELLREAKAADATLRRLLDDIAHVDGTIRTDDPAYRAPKIRAVPLPHHSRGALAILRDAKAPMLVKDIAVRMLTEEGRDPKDPKMVRTMVACMRNTLGRHRKMGTVRSAPGPGQSVLWEVAR